MVVSFENSLNSWLGSLGKLEKRELYGMHLGLLVPFRYVKLDMHFIHAALEALDPIHHVFLFDNNEFPPEPAILSAGYIVWMKGPSQRDISLSGPVGAQGSRARRPTSIDYDEGDGSVARPVLHRFGSKGGSLSSRLGRLASSFSRRLGKGKID
ncbi:hypothetical protein SOVF_119150 [Spinacia oleracea]|nr:hypothetical protein SOVF_119150 [Spinacia oleracea]